MKAVSLLKVNLYVCEEQMMSHKMTPSHHRLPLQNIQIKSLELITQETFMSYLPKMEKI